jgi:hypothetical protein
LGFELHAPATSLENIGPKRRQRLELSAPDAGATALDLVYQAADVFRSIEERARETEARAQSLCRSASEKLRRAEMRAETAERAQRELIISAEQKLRDASRSLEQAQSRIETQQDQLTAVEFRAQAAEAEAREAKQALALVEEGIRRQLLVHILNRQAAQLQRPRLAPLSITRCSSCALVIVSNPAPTRLTENARTAYENNWTLVA